MTIFILTENYGLKLYLVITKNELANNIGALGVENLKIIFEHRKIVCSSEAYTKYDKQFLNNVSFFPRIMRPIAQKYEPILIMIKDLLIFKCCQ